MARLSFIMLLGCLLLFSPMCSASCTAPSNLSRAVAGTRPECVLRVAAYDVGSATTKMQVADVDVCNKVVVARLDRASEPVAYGQDVADDGALEPTTIAKGVAALARLHERAAILAPEQHAAVATEAIRSAHNRDTLLDAIARHIDIDIAVISQHREADLAFRGAVAKCNIDADRAVVWDIGGESMQLTASIDGELHVHGVDFASGDMRRAMSDNPVSSDEAARARRYARDNALGRIPAWLSFQLGQADTVVIGVGAWRYFPGGQNALQQAMVRSLDKSDAEIGGTYSELRVPTLALMLGTMDALSLGYIEPARADLTDGLLVVTNR